MYYFSVAACLKNEHHCIKEWIEHYKFHGVDHLYLINDFSTPEYLEIIQEYIDNGYVTLFQNDIVTKEVGRQNKIYEKYLRGILHETEWLAVIDLDEFLYSPSEINLKNILQKYQDYSGIQVKWIHFGSNGHIQQPKSLVEGFTMRARLNQTGVEFQSHKMIVKTKDLISFDIHSIQIKGNILYLTQESEDFLINHYTIQSWEFFSSVKSTRGDCDNWFDHIGYSRNKSYFDNYDLNQELDDRLKNQNKMNNEVTLVITSCNRPFLLKPTLESFMKYNTYPIKECIIVEDSGLQGINDFSKDILKNIPVKFIYNETNIGQLKSIDKAYKEVTTEYIFHCEEDWEFAEYSFIEKSMEILKKDEKIYTVWLRPYTCTSGHPIIEEKDLEYNTMKRDFSYIDNGVTYTWYGITFNPGLRRTEVCMKFHPYSEIKKYESSDFGGEYSINVAYGKLGYYAAITKNKNGYVKHIGWDHHIKRPWE